MTGRRAGAGEVVGRPAGGRVFETRRRVRYGDADRFGLLRLDAIARYIQDVAGDETDDAGVTGLATWVVRRCLVEVVKPAKAWESLSVATWCGGLGSHWAERVVTFTGDQGADIRTASIWVWVDPASLRPARLTPAIHEMYGATADGRRVTASLALPADVPDDAVRRPWAIRHVDVDVLGHGNNALAWAMVEEALADAGARLGRGTADAPVRVEVEFREAMPPAGHIELCWRRSDDADGPFDAWSLRTDEEGRSTTLMASRVSSVRPLPG